MNDSNRQKFLEAVETIFQRATGDSSKPVTVVTKEGKKETHYLAQSNGCVAGAPPQQGGSPQLPDVV